MLKCLLFIVKVFALLIAICFCISLICFVISFVISFLIMKTGLFFLGIVLALIACIIVNVIIVLTLFNFILNKKTDLKVLLFIFIGSIILLGIGIGIGAIGFTNFDFIDDINNTLFYKEDSFVVPMKDDLVIYDLYYGYYNVEYLVDDRSDIKIAYKHTDFFEISYNIEDNYLYLDIVDNNNYLKNIRQGIKDINDKKIIDYSNFKVYIYASEENINKLKMNRTNYFDELQNSNEYYHNYSY